jgi:hypothetical protein
MNENTASVSVTYGDRTYGGESSEYWATVTATKNHVTIGVYGTFATHGWMESGHLSLPRSAVDQLIHELQAALAEPLPSRGRTPERKVAVTVDEDPRITRRKRDALRVSIPIAKQ